jgi:DNA-binding transcriptional ArsR family regulator
MAARVERRTSRRLRTIPALSHPRTERKLSLRASAPSAVLAATLRATRPGRSERTRHVGRHSPRGSTLPTDCTDSERTGTPCAARGLHGRRDLGRVVQDGDRNLDLFANVHSAPRHRRDFEPRLADHVEPSVRRSRALGRVSHPLSSIDPLVHAPTRLMVLTHLYVVDAADYTILVNQTDLTWGNLSAHLSKLEDAGYGRISRTRRSARRLRPRARRSRFHVTPGGARARTV